MQLHLFEVGKKVCCEQLAPKRCGVRWDRMGQGIMLLLPCIRAQNAKEWLFKANVDSVYPSKVNKSYKVKKQQLWLNSIYYESNHDINLGINVSLIGQVPMTMDDPSSSRQKCLLALWQEAESEQMMDSAGLWFSKCLSVNTTKVMLSHWAEECGLQPPRKMA